MYYKLIAFLLLSFLYSFFSIDCADKKKDNLFIKKQQEVEDKPVVNEVCYKQCFDWRKAQAMDDDTAAAECTYECRTVKRNPLDDL